MNCDRSYGHSARLALVLVWLCLNCGTALARTPPVEARRVTPDAVTVVCEAPAEYQTAYRDVNGTVCTVIRAPGTDELKRRGYPELPWVSKRVLVPVGRDPVLRIVAAVYDEIVCPPPVPSTGFLSRSGAPAPLQFAAFYASTDTYPEQPATLSPARNVGGSTFAQLCFYPFSYNAGTGKLRVCRRLELEVTWPDKPVRKSPVTGLRGSGNREARQPSPEFASLVRRNALNPPAAVHTARTVATKSAAATTAPAAASDSNRSTYTPLPEAGRLLIIMPAGYADSLQDFITWKRQRGLSVVTATYPADTGSGDSNLAAYISTQAADTDFIILVGDSGNIPPRSVVVDAESTPTDTRYTLVSGSDLYQDLFISRISATTPAGVATQAARFIAYEKTPLAPGDPGWYQRGTVIASNLTQGTFGEDRKMLEAERQKWLANGFTTVDPLYDTNTSTVTAGQVSTALNAGRNLVFYLGHGSTQQWTTGLFNSTAASALTNGAMRPFVISGACVTGNFTYAYGDCLAEAFMKAPGGGASGFVGATTNMDWDPPIIMEQEITRLITDGAARTQGALTFGGVQAAMDWCYATPAEGAVAAEKIMSQTHLFGDCSLEFRCRPPAELSVSHPDTVVAATPFTVSVTEKLGPASGVAGAAVCLYRAGELQVAATTDAQGLAVLTAASVPGDEITLTVYHRDYVPYQARVGGALRISTAAALPVAIIGESYSVVLHATGGKPPCRWQVTTPETLPGWLNLAADGTLSGTPGAGAGPATFTVSATDTAPTTVTQAFTLVTGHAVTLTTTVLPRGTVNAAYGTTLQATGDFPPFTFALTSGDLPTGLALNPITGEFHGTPTVAGDFALAFTATDAQGHTATHPLPLSIDPAPAITISTPFRLPDAIRTVAYSLTFAASGGTGHGFTWTLSEGALPEGITLSPAGVLAGATTSAGMFAFHATVADNATPPCTATGAFSLTVNSPVFFTGTQLPVAISGVPYDTMLPLAGSYQPFTVTALNDTSDYSHATASSTFELTGDKQTAWTADEAEWAVDLPFPFPFYGVTYTSIRVGDDGYLIPGTNTGPGPTRWDATGARLASLVMIAPLWTDLVFNVNKPGTGIFITRAPLEVTIRWCGQDYHNPDWLVNFAVTLGADGSIRTAYGSINTANRMVIGISDGHGKSQLLEEQPWSSARDYTLWSNHADVVFAPYSNLPPGLTLDHDGRLHGTPTAAGAYEFPVFAVDDHGYSANATLALTVLPTVTVTLDLAPGWNCVALPITPLDGTPASVFPGHTGPVWTWNTSSQSYDDATALAPRQGCWVYWPGETPQTFAVTGVAVGDQRLALSQGWNLCGPSLATPLPTDGSVQIPVWQWRHGAYATTPSLEPGNAYWIYAPQPVTLTPP